MVNGAKRNSSTKRNVSIIFRKNIHSRRGRKILAHRSDECAPRKKFNENGRKFISEGDTMLFTWLTNRLLLIYNVFIFLLYYSYLKMFIWIKRTNDLDSVLYSVQNRAVLDPLLTLDVHSFDTSGFHRNKPVSRLSITTWLISVGRNIV